MISRIELQVFEHSVYRFVIQFLYAFVDRSLAFEVWQERHMESGCGLIQIRM